MTTSEKIILACKIGIGCGLLWALIVWLFLPQNTPAASAIIGAIGGAAGSLFASLLLIK